MGAKLWNEMPASLKKLPKNLFKKKIKSILLNVFNEEDSFIDINAIISMVKFKG